MRAGHKLPLFFLQHVAYCDTPERNKLVMNERDEANTFIGLLHTKFGWWNGNGNGKLLFD
jgi:hypothetical protein